MHSGHVVELHIPNPTVNSDFSLRLTLFEEPVSRGFDRLQTSVKGARVNPVNRGLYVAEILCKLFRLLHPLRCQRRVCRNTSRSICQ